MKIDWKTKLTSRKLWAAAAAFAATLLTAIFRAEIPDGVADLIGKGVIALCAYIFGEAGVDIARAIWAKASGSADTGADAETSAAISVAAETGAGVDAPVDAGGVADAGGDRDNGDAGGDASADASPTPGEID